ncbi:MULTISPECIES: YbhB/YbcL family Raf kinase inhibitor-like protein [Micromonospora]|uniref:YbhB/YbcL family Raf kinase inhibitor-like protein n=1 Tax=Micromonospora solifontis TaxID=2487138 RepID=A0ABX9WKM5_9ACTN|nr:MULTISPECIES: YbhB/YbcL family Raf kinase inhibitor-like protein [Micromonospora]NES14629.1 YbhB/YbcL family Raf kinase inhibitor-like protein [Micromonospora sp. PPF5-17B]NES35233.1 YbhB/YbcL family Raf kinase inhibitor-like protein [Micromonospora solifontis]NES58403.1 YbhB/YbcL family Raf kinase inhibitor-like protein [Micromonospora sp. PPF5-6]RNM00965.1 YbhB/YbcL family Raf kinase inhibitor-like protein [Micromonospora solifontis]
MAGIMLRSTAFNDHDMLPGRFAQEGGNVSPPLEWSPVPEATELVLMVEDRDAGKTPFLHWLVTGISPRSGGVAEGAVPDGGREWPNDFGATGWAGPNPPRHEDPHRYFFRLYALERPLDLPDSPQAEDVHRALADREFASGTMVGTYFRS